MKARIFVNMIIIILIFILGTSAADGRSFYVNYENGINSNDGLSPENAWKHAPGDDNAADVPSNIVLEPGDTILFKGGVIYRGTITLKYSGEEGNPITYKGDGWGNEKAIIDGTDVLNLQWTQCESQEAARGNPHWQSIYYSSYTTELSPFNQYFDDGNRIYISQEPNMSDPFWDDDISQYNTVLNGNITHTSLKDDGFFTQSSSDFWDGAYVQMWVVPNVIKIRKINSFDPASHTIYYDTLADNEIYGNRDQYYSVVNHLSILDSPGQYVVDEANKKIYYWPLGDIEECIFSAGVRSYGIGINGHSNITIEGFKVQGNSSDNDSACYGIWNNRTWGDAAVNIVVRNNEITHIRTKDGRKGSIDFSNTDGLLIENNNIHDCQRNSGILVGTKNTIIRNNNIERVGYKGIWSMNSENLRVLDNVISECSGTHGNAVSIFTTHNCVFAGNKLTGREGEILTYSGNEDFIVSGNLIVGDVVDGVKTGLNLIRENQDLGNGYLIIVNNTVLNSSTGYGFNFSPHIAAPDKQYILNNIVDGGADFRVNHISHNIYTSLSWRQRSSEWDYSEGEFLVSDMNTLFADVSGGDYTLAVDSPARDAGVDLNEVLPAEVKDMFSDYDLNQDFKGDIRGADGTWDIGAFEFRDNSPVIIKQPELHTVEAGHDIMFSVEALGSDMSYQWQYEGQNGFEDIQDETTATLMINNVQQDAEGYYQVKVSNITGTVISDKVFLNVVDEVPKINNFNCKEEFNTVYLSWDNPDLQDNDWDKVLVIRKRDDTPSSPEDGEEIYNDTGTYVIDQNVDNGEYNYAVYTYIETDTDILYSEAVTAKVLVTDVLYKKLLRIDPGKGRIKIGQNTRGDLYSIWNEEDITIGRGPTGNESSLWINSNIIVNAENQIPAGSEILSARLVFTVQSCLFDEEISEDNSENENINSYSDNVGNPVEASYIGRSIYGSYAHCIKLYQISDPDNLGLPHYGEESGVRVGLDFNYRDHRPGMNIPWVDIDENDEEQVNNEDNLNEDSKNEMEQYKPGSIQFLLNELEPVDILEFSSDVFTDGKVKTLQLDITEVVQNYSEEAAANPGDGSASEEQGMYITIDYGWNKGEYIRLYGSTAEVEDGEAETEESKAGAKDEEDGSDIRPYLEIIYSDSTDDLTSPDPVQGLTVIPGNDSVELSWTNPSDSDFTGVKIIRREGMIPYNIQDGSNGEEGVFVDFLEETGNTGSEVTYIDSNLLTGHRYYYAVYTYDDSYNYSEPVWIRGVPGSTESPENLSTSNIGIGELTLSWNKGTGADSYRIYYEDIEGNNILIDEVVDENPENQGTELEYTDYVSSGEYIYRVSAVNENGEGPLSEGLVVTVGNNAAEEPVAPTGLIAEAISSSKIRINWTDQLDNEIGFVIERKTGESDWEEVGKTRHDRTEYIDSELLPATRYSYRIKAFNSAGEIYSDNISCITEDGPVQQISWQLISASQIRVEWEDVMDDVSYRVEIYELDSTREISEDDEALDSQLISGVDYCYFVSLEPAKEYRVKVISIKNNDEIGTTESDIIRTSMDPKGGLF